MNKKKPSAQAILAAKDREISIKLLAAQKPLDDFIASLFK